LQPARAIAAATAADASSARIKGCLKRGTPRTGGLIDTSLSLRCGDRKAKATAAVDQ
jgi:hypothetical protein